MPRELKKDQTVLNPRKLPSQVRSRSAFIIAIRAKELGMDLGTVAKAIDCTEQYARDLLQGTKIPSLRKVRDITTGLNLDNLKTEQIRVVSMQDRVRHDSRYRRIGL